MQFQNWIGKRGADAVLVERWADRADDHLLRFFSGDDEAADELAFPGAGCDSGRNVCQFFRYDTEGCDLDASIGPIRIARKFGVRQTRAEVGELIGPDRDRSEKIVRAGDADDVVLINAVTADADRADELAIAIERKASRENRDAIWKSRVGAGRIEDVVRERRAPEPRELFLQSVVWARVLHVEPGGILRLGEEADGARGNCERIVREANGGASLLHRHVPTEKRGLTRAERAEDGRLFRRIVRIIFDGDEDLHRHADGQTNPGARRPRTVGGEGDDARDFRGRQARLPVDRSRQRIAHNRLADFALNAAEGRDRIRKRRRRTLNRVARSGIAGDDNGSDRRRGRQDVGERDAVDVNVVGLNRAVGTKSKLPGERDLFVYVVARDKCEWILRTEDERPWHAVACHADAADEFSILVKRNTPRRTVQGSAEHGIDR